MEGIQSIWREWLGYTQEAMQRQMEGFSAMARSRRPQTYAGEAPAIFTTSRAVCPASTTKRATWRASCPRSSEAT